MADQKSGIKMICENRKARFNYSILETFEAGIILQGSEVKSLREGRASLGDAYAMVKDGEVFLYQAHIPPHQQTAFAHDDPLQTRKLLLHKNEINKLTGRTVEKGLTLVPLKMYFKNGRAKLELALAKSKKTEDKRTTIKKREADREMDRAIKAGKK
jgi:SsrA-binding protein